LFDLSETDARSICFKYQDEDGDLCTLTEASITDALALADVNRKTLRLIANIVPLAEGAGADVTEGLGQGQGQGQDEAMQVTPFESTPAPECERFSMSQRWSAALPRIEEGFAHFKEQVASDFRNNCADMKVAIDKSENVEQPPRAAQVAGQIAGTAAGVFAAGRMIPLRGVRLAAQSVAALTGTEASVSEPSSPVATAVESTAGAPGTDADSAGMEVEHFKQQVAQDFEAARQEMRAAFGYFGGGSTSPAAPVSAEQGSSAFPYASSPQRIGTELVPAIASTVAGISVATTMVPLRAARLAVASVTARAGTPSGGRGSIEAAVPEAQGQPRLQQTAVA